MADDNWLMQTNKLEKQSRVCGEIDIKNRKTGMKNK